MPPYIRVHDTGLGGTCLNWGICVLHVGLDGWKSPDTHAARGVKILWEAGEVE